MDKEYAELSTDCENNVADTFDLLKEHRKGSLHMVITTVISFVLGSDWSFATIEFRRYLLFKNSFARMVPFYASFLGILCALFLPVIIMLLSLKGKTEGSLKRMILTGLPWIWIAWLPILYFIFGNPAGDMGEEKTNMFSIVGGWLVLVLSAIKFGNNSLQIDVAAAVELEKNEINEEGDPVARELLHKVSDPMDGRSFYPLFIASELDEPRVVKHNTINIVRTWLLTVVVALMALQPTIHSVFWKNASIYCGWSTLLNVSVALAAAYTAHNIIVEVESVTDDFSDCVDEVQIFLFLAATPDMRVSETLKGRFVDILQRSSARRKWLSDNGIKRKEIINNIEPEATYARAQRRGRGSSQKGVDKCTRISRAITPPTILPEVIAYRDWSSRQTFSLQSRRFELFLNSRDGLRLFRRMYRWVSVDVTNEGFEASMQANLVLLMAIFIMAGGLAGLIRNKMHMEMEHGMAFFAAFVLFVYFFRLCMLCIAMNEAMFGEVDQLLMEWKALSSKPGDDVAHMWDKTYTESNSLKKYPSQENAISRERIPVEVRAMLDVTRERVRVLDRPSTLMGFAITNGLLKRIITLVGASAATVVVAIVKNFIKHHSKH